MNALTETQLLEVARNQKRILWLLYSRLSTEHPKALQILAESSAGVMAFQRYLWKRQYLGLDDAVFTRYADYLRRYWVGWLWFFLLVVVASVAAIAAKT